MSGTSRVFVLAAVLAAGLLSLVPPASAESQPGKPPLLAISASAERDVANDEMNVVMRVEQQGKDLASTHREALTRIDALLANARAVEAVESSLSAMGSNPVYAEARREDGKVEREIAGWHVQADAVLKSRNIQALSKLIGELAGDARVVSVTFSVSRAARKQVEDELLVEAAQAFRARAANLATTLGYGSYEIEQVSIGATGMPRPYRPVAQEALVSLKAAAAPVADFAGAAGESSLSANANGQVWLRP